MEGSDFRDLHKQFVRAGAVVAGVSRDSLKSHEGFKAKMGFPFELVSDADEKLCAQFDVIKMKNMYGKQVRGIERSTFLIGPDGTLAREWRKRQGRRPCGRRVGGRKGAIKPLYYGLAVQAALSRSAASMRHRPTGMDCCIGS